MKTRQRRSHVAEVDDQDAILGGEGADPVEDVTEPRAAFQPAAAAELHAQARPRQLFAMANARWYVSKLWIRHGMPPSGCGDGGSLGWSASRTPASAQTGIIWRMK